MDADRFFVLEYDWSTLGIREFPFGVVVADSGRLIAAQNESNVFYVGGPAGNPVVGLMTR